MRDHDQRAAAAQSRQRLGDDVLVLGVQRGGRLVHQQDGSILEQRAGDGDALALAARQARAAFADRVSMPCGRRATISVTPAWRAAYMSSASVASGLPTRMLSAMLPVNR